MRKEPCSVKINDEVLSWVGIVILGIAHGILEDLMFIRVLVEYMPP
ncbi:uncharacterized protein METZ01_LOCUS507472, partial [marine metagenome]